MNLTIVDVFAEKPLAGNQLAVVRDASALSTDQMQAFAREMNFSETTFVTQESEQRASVRIFTPDIELPFAGHPTVGTAWLLSGGVGTYTLDLQSGAVSVEFIDGIGWLTSPPVDLGAQITPADAAALIGLEVDELAGEFPAQMAAVGPEFGLVGVKDLAALRKAKLNELVHEQMLGAGLAVWGVYIFTNQAYGPDADFASRMFFKSGGVREDPATGSATCTFAAYLNALLKKDFSAVVDQGVEMQRPSRLYLEIGEICRVGGKTRLVANAELAPDLFN